MDVWDENRVKKRFIYEVEHMKGVLFRNGGCSSDDLYLPGGLWYRKEIYFDFDFSFWWRR